MLASLSLVLYTLCGAARGDKDSLYYHIVPSEVPTDVQDLVNFENYTDTYDIPAKNDSLLFDTFVSVLTEVSTEQLRNVKSNIMSNYDLHRADVADIKRAFNNIEDKYTDIINTKLKTMLDGKPINITDHFMIDFMDVSNYILERVLRYHIKNVKGKFMTQTKWYRQTLKEKILRQQTKISFNYIENNMCETLQVCRDRYYYSDYLTDWLRTLMNVSPRDLKRFFVPITDVLESHKYFIKSNMKFRQTIKYIINAEAIVKRDTLDFLDEVLTNPDTVLKLAPNGLKPSVALLRELFSLIDGVYDVNDHNIEQLENITEMLRDWIEGKSFDVHRVLNAIVQNIRVNLQVWPLDIQSKIYYVWSEIILL
ncbi:uncharacterized protein LOC111361742 [Spodoptera litura]|uniref:Uncharacterized protein LOC111361742 n=1 Tax=Spodoptera litura TaxID=69820 RepID=A0A9J7J1S6_SPOLT|nr:uncharacterized protein LOC111361742 [Spodoptera litura]